VVVIGSLPPSFTTPIDIPDHQILPYDEAMRKEYNFYAATGGDSPNSSHTLGNEQRITINSIEYYNRHFAPDQQYSYFIRVYSEHVSYLYQKSI